MKKITALVFFCFLSFNLSGMVTTQDERDIFAEIDQLTKRALNGEIVCALAVAHFNRSIKDPEYVITFQSSIGFLVQAGLLGRGSKVHESVREAYKKRQHVFIKSEF